MNTGSEWQVTWAGRVAGHIHDPIVRLRFLKAIGPAQAVGKPARGFQRWLVAVLVLVVGLAMLVFALARSRLKAETHPKTAMPHQSAAPFPAPKPGVAPEVWLVEKTGDLEPYSNGLRIDTRFQVETHRRSYLAFPPDHGAPDRREEPAGIVFHTTESLQAPFQAGENGVLKRIGESLLEYVRRRQSYNFVIDRFGRAFRVVPESDAANHAGYSAWADGHWVYIDLNESFLGIAFEAASPAAPGIQRINPAQVRSAAMLVEWLRGRYRIPTTNCVTHAQVSVNPANMLIGLHHDWASGFPFEELGLPDNYVLPLPSMWACGFECDTEFTARAGMSLRAGIEAARTLLLQQAAAAGLSPAQYRKRIRQRYGEMRAIVHNRLDREIGE
jgi:N-acetylmuramoyl-L-alanine amidase